ncbi:MAG: Asp-tRNA(Asn)/Glu-tRNA(Gln) amidotransferase subunit GatB [Tissierellia bacterium]|jgi:aspartyl-tRNA(Asn)/glutamyl-tRNA(Gln) amidotransferase subunit B|nr:Asp-tRNA(Asn)/Glu-tRNA(Gln) amidotransferase subunit GatB [Tissierellia bacterium]
MTKNYETVMGLEVHVELKTNTKIFCNCSTKFGEAPNTNTCPVCLGLPGALPVLNEKVIDLAVMAGLATNCKITRVGKQDRKNYFYPDLGKGYQISQDDNPICQNGYLDIETSKGKKRIRINRIHIEEDAGKLIHEESIGSLVDNNRASTPLIEIVSEPDLRTAEEVLAYLQKLRANLTYLDVSDAKMNEGSFRCDVNLSIREVGEEKFGTRVEMKNLNSFQSIQRAIEYESARQIKAIESGEELFQETRGYSQDAKKTYSMRSKEDAADYRYLPDPDLMPIVITDEKIENIKKTLPELPDARKIRYIEEYDLSNYDSEQLISSIEVANFFEETVKAGANPKSATNLIITEIFRLASPEDFNVGFSPKSFAQIIGFVDSGRINLGSAKKVIEIMFENPGKSPEEIVLEEDLEQINDITTLSQIIDEVLLRSEKAVNEYKSGKEKALQSIIGQVMGRTKGKANPQLAIEILKDKLN